MDGEKGSGRKRFQVSDGIKENGEYDETKRLAQDRIKWRQP